LPELASRWSEGIVTAPTTAKNMVVFTLVSFINMTITLTGADGKANQPRLIRSLSGKTIGIVSVGPRHLVYFLFYV